MSCRTVNIIILNLHIELPLNFLGVLYFPRGKITLLLGTGCPGTGNESICRICGRVVCGFATHHCFGFEQPRVLLVGWRVGSWLRTGLGELWFGVSCALMMPLCSPMLYCFLVVYWLLLFHFDLVAFPTSLSINASFFWSRWCRSACSFR